MPFAVRLFVAVLMLGVAAFCVFGFLATYEPTDQIIWPWRIGYGAIGVASLLAVGSLAFRKGKNL